MKKNIVLQNSVARVVIAPELGGSILSYEVILNGTTVQIFKPSLQAKLVRETCYFPLVPYSNRIRSGRFKWLESDISLPLNNKPEKHSLHGHGWQTHWDVVRNNDLSIQLEYRYKQAEWPFNYRVIQSIRLENEILKMELKIINQSELTMPVGLGFHPYFSRTPLCRVSAKVGKMWATDDEIMPTNLVDAPANLNSLNGIKVDDFQLDNCLIDFEKQAIIYWPEWQSKVTIIASNNCPFLVFYSQESDDYFCLEPVTHSTDAINLAAKGQLNTGMVSLPSDQEFSISMQIIPEATTAL